MKNPIQLTRRTFVQSALATTAACGLAHRGDAFAIATSAAPRPIIDTHVYVGQWPFARLPGNDPKELVAMLQDSHVATAWAGSFEGLFHKDIAGVNERLANTCAKFGSEVLMPFGSVNPTLPDWEEDVRRCHETFQMPGIRLHPNYHGYSLDDPRFARLPDLAATRGLIVHLVAWLEDKPRKWLRPRKAEVDLKPLGRMIRNLPNAKVVLANGIRSASDEVFRELAPLEQVSFDVGRLNNTDDFDQLVAATSAGRVVVGSGAPLYPISQTTK